jgi:predicted Zn-dependent peptidase
MSVSPYCYLLEKTGMLAIQVTGQAGSSLDELNQILSDEIDLVVKEGVSEEEFQKARNAMESQFAQSGGTMADRARTLAHYSMFYGDTSLINTELERYLAVKREDLHRVAKKYFTVSGKFLLRYPTSNSK